MDKNALPHAGSRRCPRSTRARRVASKLALAGSDIDATIPAGRRLPLGAAEGEGCCRLGFAIAANSAAWCLRFGHGIPDTIRRPGAGRVQAFDPCCFDLGVPSVGGDWPGLAPAGECLSCGDEKVDKKRPCRSAGPPVPSLHPRPAGRVETRPGGLRHRRDNSRRPQAALGAAEGEAAAGSASPLPAGCGAFVWARHSGCEISVRLDIAAEEVPKTLCGR